MSPPTNRSPSLGDIAQDALVEYCACRWGREGIIDRVQAGLIDATQASRMLAMLARRGR
jgi:hypothetical protein